MLCSPINNSTNLKLYFFSTTIAKIDDRTSYLKGRKTCLIIVELSSHWQLMFLLALSNFASISLSILIFSSRFFYPSLWPQIKIISNLEYAIYVVGLKTTLDIDTTQHKQDNVLFFKTSRYEHNKNLFILRYTSFLYRKKVEINLYI